MKRAALLVSAALAIGCAGPVFAQAIADAPAASAPGAGWTARVAEWRQMREQRRQDRMGDLHTVLRIRPEQETSFQAFAAALQPAPHEPHERLAAMQGAQTMTTPQLIDRMEARKAGRAAQMRQRADAVKRFYAVLSPEQQQVFDALHRLAMGHEHGWGRPMHGMGGHGWGGHDRGGDAQG